MNITDLPTDIKLSIFECATDDANTSLNAFSSALPILWICREWRLLALANVYSCAQLFANTTESALKGQKSYIYEAETNYELICCNKLQHLVTDLYITHISTPDDMDIRSLVNQLIKACISDNAPIKRKHKYIVDCPIYDTTTTYNDKMNKMHVINDALFVQTFQNVKCIDVFTNEFLPDNPMHIDTLVAGYGNRLSSVKYYGPNVRLNLSLANKLTELDLFVKIERDDPYLPLITPTNPQSLQSCKLEAISHVHLCGLFCWCPDSNIIEFNNLRRLELIGDFSYLINSLTASGNLEPEANVCAHELSFPALVDLRVDSYYRCNIELECLLRAPLKRLVYSGLASHFLQFYKKLPSTLEYLNFAFSRDACNANLVYNLNRILSTTQGIKTIELDIGFYNSKFDVTNISWPNVTHINLMSNNSFYDILRIVNGSPDLIELIFTLRPCHIGVIDDLAVFLLSIKQHYSHPTSSKIHTLTILHSNGLVNDSLKKAAENLKWYWPNLQSIIFE